MNFSPHFLDLQPHKSTKVAQRHHRLLQEEKRETQREMEGKRDRATIKFTDLPLNKSHPPHSAWIYGDEDSLGTLNELTDEHVSASAQAEIRTGQRVCLNWTLNDPIYPGFGRQPFKHTIIKKEGRCVCDDVIEMNTQHSSQWDGLRHFGYQARGDIKEGVFYNNLKPADFLDPVTNQLTEPSRSGSGRKGNKGIGEVAKHGIAGRAVLLDIYGFTRTAASPEARYDPWKTHQIPLRVIQDCMAHQNVTLKPRDILILRTGYHAIYNAHRQGNGKGNDTGTHNDQGPAKARHHNEDGNNDNEKNDDNTGLRAIKAKSEAGSPGYAGVAQDLAITEWLWTNRVAAVAGDAPAFESWPPQPSRDTNPASGGFMQHEILLGGWGMPIGEMWYLEHLVEICRSLDRWTFFLSSSPLNVPGGVASPPNVMAIF